MISHVTTKADMVFAVRTEVEVSTQCSIINSRTVGVIHMVNRHASCLSVTPSFFVFIDAAVMGIDGTEIGKEVRT